MQIFDFETCVWVISQATLQVVLETRKYLAFIVFVTSQVRLYRIYMIRVN